LFDIDIYNKCYKSSLRVVKLYDVLTDVAIDCESSLMEFNLFVEELRKAIIDEDKCYNELSIDDVKNFLFQLKNIVSEEGILFSDVRVNNKLSYMVNRLHGNVLENESLFPTLDEKYELDLIDLIDSKFVIDTYKLLNKKLNSISLSDSKSLKMTKMIDKLNVEHIIYKISLYVLAEKLAIDSNFNISKLPMINLEFIKKRIIDEKKLDIDIDYLINLRAYNSVVSLLDGFNKLGFNGNDYVNVYDNLVYCTEFEVLFEYLTLEQLKEVDIKLKEIASDNNMVVNNVRKLVINKINSNYI